MLWHKSWYLAELCMSLSPKKARQSNRNWIFDLNYGHETEQVVGSAWRMDTKYLILAVQYTHKPTGFIFTNYRIRNEELPPLSTSHDLLL